MFKELLDWNQIRCLTSSAKAKIDCVHSFLKTDFRDDLKKINIPVLIIPRDSDHIVAIGVPGNKTAEQFHMRNSLFTKMRHKVCS